MMGRKSKDYSNMRFGMLTVIRKSEKKDSRGNFLWECKCDCGNICYYIGSKLSSRKSCGCLTKPINEKSYIEKIFNSWLILDTSYKTDKGWMMKCKCLNCGTIKDVNIYNIINNKSKDCGCGRKEHLAESKRKYTVDNLKGCKFGKLAVISEAGRDKYGKIKYKCLCDCGKETVVLGRCLLEGRTESCGCLTSKHNSEINQILTDMGYGVTAEKYVKLENEDISYFRFDIFIEELNLAIEYDGEQHFLPIDFAGKGEEWAKEQLQSTQQRDKIKNNYCKQNNINLLRISYMEKNNIKQLIINKINEITNND